jgi:hypothetical protein
MATKISVVEKNVEKIIEKIKPEQVVEAVNL